MLLPENNHWLAQYDLRAVGANQFSFPNFKQKA
jgi:hypothetical protein